MRIARTFLVFLSASFASGEDNNVQHVRKLEENTSEFPPLTPLTPNDGGTESYMLKDERCAACVETTSFQDIIDLIDTSVEDNLIFLCGWQGTYEWATTGVFEFALEDTVFIFKCCGTSCAFKGAEEGITDVFTFSGTMEDVVISGFTLDLLELDGSFINIEAPGFFEFSNNVVTNAQVNEGFIVTGEDVGVSSRIYNNRFERTESSFCSGLNLRSGEVFLEGNNFFNNLADSEKGGAMCLFTMFAVLRDNHFEGNSVGRDGLTAVDTLVNDSGGGRGTRGRHRGGTSGVDVAVMDRIDRNFSFSLFPNDVTVQGVEDNDGGAIHASSSVIISIKNMYIANFAQRVGGAWFLQNSCATFKGDIFRGNEAAGDPQVGAGGGGIEAVNGKVESVDSIYKDNTSAGIGGAWDLDSVCATSTGDLFVNNEAGFSGGAIDFDSGYLISTKSVYKGNRAVNPDSNGGGIYSLGGRLESYGDRFQENFASTLGGGVYLFGNSNIVKGAKFIGNTARFGGGLACDDAVCRVKESIFKANEATAITAGDDIDVDRTVLEICESMLSSGLSLQTNQTLVRETCFKPKI